MATVGPWDTDDLKVLYHLSEAQFHPPMSAVNFENLMVYLLNDIVVDIKYYVTEDVYDTYATDDDFKTKLQRCMALCLINDMYHQHGMTLSTGGQISSESIPDFASVSYRYPTIDTKQTMLNKTRLTIILDLLGRYVPSDAPVQPPSSSAPVHGDFLYFNEVEDQLDVEHAYED